ncbi:cilia- and flagella-associated protein 20-like [Belonocnema kinseyi]|uniref:cilia- and flagella-associated protein 20-like n=1 Tax=Belonocnema kinseyi TaxID=2817044 RepID=UPI00143CCAA1|nr:cilia- and flagella-associated protein 20-like [Belonocnema kinseyi]
MYRNSYQSGRLSILYSCGPSPLEFWAMKVKNGYIRRVTDGEVRSLALELNATNVATTYIICPKDSKKSLGIRMPFLVLIIKNMKKYFTFEITVLDDKNLHRRFRVSNFQSVTRIRPFCTSMPIGLSEGWNQIHFNLADFTRRAYGSNYVETVRMQIHANCRIRRIYFADRLYPEDELPNDFKLFFPLEQKACTQEMKREKKSLENVLGDISTSQTPRFDTNIKTSAANISAALPSSSSQQQNVNVVDDAQDVPHMPPNEHTTESFSTEKESATMQLELSEHSIPSRHESDAREAMENDDEGRTLRPMFAPYENETENEALEFEEEWLQNED